jgi:hypothetical protein
MHIEPLGKILVIHFFRDRYLESLLTFHLLCVGRKGKLWIIGIAIPLVAILLCSTFTFLWLMRRKKGLLRFVDAVVVFIS